MSNLACDCPPVTGPTLAGFQAWVRGTMGVPTSALPDGSPYFQYAYCVASAVVSRQLCVVPLIYQLAVYNLGGSNLVNWAQDVAPSTYWADLRTSLKLADFVAGVVQSSSDEGTSVGLTVPEQMQNFTVANLQQLKDPWGRTYLGFAQSVGSLWGIS